MRRFLPLINTIVVLICLLMAGKAVADTFRDNFSSLSYSNQNGSHNWSSNWNENGDDFWGWPFAGEIQIQIFPGRLRLQDNNKSISRSANLSIYTTATLSFDYQEVGFDNDFDSVSVEVRAGGSGGWTTLATFANSGIGSGSASYNIPSIYLNAVTEIRFITSTSNAMNSNDVFYIDNVQVEAFETVLPPSPVAEWRMDELYWSGASGEVSDVTGNGNNGTALQVASGVQTIADGFICRAATFPDISSDTSHAINTGVTVSSAIGNRGSISLWHRSANVWASTGTNKTLWDASSAGSDNKYFYLVLLANGRLRFGMEDPSDGDYRIETSSPLPIAANDWAHVVVNWNVGGSSQAQIWVNGVQQAVTTVENTISGSALGNTYTLYIGDNRSTYYAEDANRAAAGDIDEVLLFDQVLSGTQINEIRTLQLGGMNLDGTVRTCPTTPVAEYYFDEASWNGSNNEVLDSSGGGLDGSSNDASTIAGGQICRAGSFNGSSHYLTVNGIDSYLRTTATVSFWVNTTQTGNNTHWLAPGVAGIEQSGGANDIFWGWIDAAGRIGVGVGDTGHSKSTTIINDGTWHHIVQTRDAVTGELQTYVDGVLEDTTNGNTGVIGNGFSSIGRIEDTAGTHVYYAGDIDEIVIFNAVLDAAQVQSIYNNQLAGNNWDGSARVCASIGVDHYAISASGSGITCEPLAVTITAYDNNDIAITPSNGTVINLSTSTNRGLWTGNSTDDGTVSYTFDGSSDFVVLDLLHAVVGTVNIDINSGSSPNEDSGNDPDIVFYDSSFRFVDASDNSIDVQVSARPSTTHYLKAVRTDEVTQQCVAMFQNQTVNVDFAAECENPASCTDANGNGSADLPLQLSYNGGGFFTVPTNNEDGTPSALSFSTLQAVSFDASGRAPVVLRYDDAGRINIHARAEIIDSNGNATGEFIDGFNNFVVKPAGLCVQAQDMDGAGPRSPDCSTGDISCFVYIEAGNPFDLLVSGKAWVSDSESNSDFCDNSTTPNFVLNSIALSSAFVAPAGGVDGSLSTTSVAISSGGEVTVSETHTEVGVFTFTASPTTNYFGETISASSSANVGRFIPHHFVLENMIVTPALGNFTYLGQSFDAAFDIRAVDINDNTTSNYLNSFRLLDVGTDLNYGGVNDAGGTPVSLNGRVTADFAIVDISTGGLAAVNNVPLTITRSASVDGPFLLAELGLEIEDADGVRLLPSNLDLDTTLDSNNDKQKLHVGAMDFRYGRVNIGPVYGPEVPTTAVTPVPFVLEYWDGSNFMRNTDDNMTDPSPWTWSSGSNCYDPNGSDTLVCTDTAINIPVTTVSGGQGSLTANRPGETGELNMEVVVDSWLQFVWGKDWDNDSTTTDDINPSFPIHFGTYRGHDRIIYWREVH